MENRLFQNVFSKLGKHYIINFNMLLPIGYAHIRPQLLFDVQFLLQHNTAFINFAQNTDIEPRIFFINSFRNLEVGLDF